MSTHALYPTDNLRKWIAGGLFFFLAGAIVGIPDWPAQTLGIPLMLLGIAIPAVSHWRARAASKAQRDRNARARRARQADAASGGAGMYEIQSWRYKSTHTSDTPSLRRIS